MFSKKPLIIAHRGASAYLPENTLEAIDLAISKHGVDMTEFDVHLSKDNVPVIIHDETLERTTNGSGYVSNKTLQELKALDAGNGFKIPTLEELFKSFPKHPLSVEIKQKSELLVHKTIELIEKYHDPNLCIVGSKHHLVSKIMREKYPLIKRFCSEKDVLSLLAQSKTGIFNAKVGLNAVASIPCQCKGIDLTNLNWINFLHSKEIKVFYWTINDGGQAKTLVQNGADGIITNDALQIKEALRNLGGTAPTIS